MCSSSPLRQRSRVAPHISHATPRANAPRVPPHVYGMANLSQEDGAPKPATNSADVSTIAQTSSGNVADTPGGFVAPVPCLIPSFADAVKLLKERYSCLVLEKHRRHISLPPVHLRKKRTGIQEELNSELLKYSSSLKGVPVAYDSIKVVGQHGDIYDDAGFIHLNIEASFVVFKPKRGLKLVGVINKIGVGHVGCLVHGCFNASVVKPFLLTSEQWRDSGLCVGQNLEFEVFQLDADAVVQELVEQFEQKESTVESTAELESTEDTIDSPKPKKKKKKDKREAESAADESLNDSSLEQTSEYHQTADDTTEIDSNANGHHKEKKKKKKKTNDRRQMRSRPVTSRRVTPVGTSAIKSAERERPRATTGCRTHLPPKRRKRASDFAHRPFHEL
ncbi:DNA-directed RNA polymerase I subunit RPA43 [Labeo rohita]|uniref:DNA-directed RNA polymerase subunit n=1 Tax=Labeo rohita TaxID=84645 RepID=A0ABQ8LRF4_LABRO|nr:DNA-directed RNA polymerase I subunit RPA43 [Labeo rohita]